MKKVLALIALVVAPLTVLAQSDFDSFEDNDKVSAVVINKSMFNLLSKIDVQVDDPEAQDYINMAKSMESIKVFATEDGKIAADMASRVDKYLKSKKLSELMRIKDEDTNVKFYIREGKDENHVRELLMFVRGVSDVQINSRKIETVLVSMTGDIDLRKIGALTAKTGGSNIGKAIIRITFWGTVAMGLTALVGHLFNVNVG